MLTDEELDDMDSALRNGRLLIYLADEIQSANELKMQNVARLKSEESEEGRRMTNGEVLEKFYKEHPDMVDKVSDYRPLALDFVGNRVGITIWLKNDDIILYFPKLTDKEKRPRKSLWVVQEANKLGEKNEYTQGEKE